MKIAIATWFPRNPASPHGGVEAVSVNLVRALAKRDDCEVHVVTVDDSLTAPQTTPLPAPCSPLPAPCFGVTIHRLPAPHSSLLAYALGQGRTQVQVCLRRLSPDVVHAHDTFGIMVRGLDLPRVFTIHGFIHEDTRYDGGRFAGLRAKLWKWAEISAWRDQPHIVSISPFVRERLRGINRGVIHDIENPIAPEFFEVKRQEVSGTIFSAAAIRRLKNTLGLVRAFEIVQRELPAARLRLAGAETELGYAAEVKAFVQSHGLGDKVSFLGALGAAQVRAELGRASVFALVSLQENAPMGIAEAMAAGVPVVTSNRCGMPHMVSEGKTGFLVDPKNSEEIAQRLRQILGDASLRETIGNGARKAALVRFHPDGVAERTLEVYRQAANLGRAGN